MIGPAWPPVVERQLTNALLLLSQRYAPLSQGCFEVCQLREDLIGQRLVGVAREADLELLAYERFMWVLYAVLPYLNMYVSPSFSLKLDQAIRKMRIFNLFFVNQSIVARKH